MFYLFPKPPAPPALHTTSLLITGGVVLLLNGLLLQLTLAPAEHLSIIVLLIQPQNGEKGIQMCAASWVTMATGDRKSRGQLLKCVKALSERAM